MALKILDIIDAAHCRRRQVVPDRVGAMVEDVLKAEDPDAEFVRYARMLIQTGEKTQAARRQAIHLLELAFKIPLPKLKEYLKERTICNQSD
jgi:hypothetical protein